MSGDHNQYQKAKSWSEARQEVSYVQLVDDECDRIVWRNQSFRLPIEWMGLTYAEIHEIADRLGLADVAWFDVMEAVEAKLKEKNHG
jgi:hypothetical protein